MKKNVLFAYLLGLFFVGFCTVDMQAQADKSAIKSWVISNKEHVTLISKAEYNKMSPTVKAVLDADVKTLIYDVEVTVANITAFQQKNTNPNLTPLKTEREEANKTEAAAKAFKEQEIANVQAIKAQEEASFLAQEHQKEELRIKKENQEKISTWLETNKHIKVISYQDYMSRPAAQRSDIDALSDKIIYANDELTWEEIVQYEESK